MDNYTFYAGAAMMDITPPVGTALGVDFIPHYARFIHDPIYAKALVFRDEKELLAIVIVDICIMGTDFIDEIKRGIQHQTGIHRKNILIASNHDHASGNVVGLLASAVDIAFRTKLPGLIVKAVQMAKEKLRPAKIASGTVNVPDYVLCRRYIMKEGYVAMNPVTGKPDKVKTNPIGAEQFIISQASPVDPGLGFMAIKGMDEKWIAILANYSLHYVGDWHEDSVTGDYFGEFSRKILSKLNAGEEFVGIMSNGTSGDVNIWDFKFPDRLPKGDYEKTSLIGETLAQKVFEALQNSHWQNNPQIAHNYKELELSVRKPSLQELEVATQTIIEKGFDNLKMDEDGISRIYAREQILLNEYPDTVRLPIQAIKIGNQIIGALPGEFFSETGLLIKKAITDSDYFSISLANGYGGYIPPVHEMERGGYETWRARSSFMEPKAEEKIRKELIKLIMKL
jgi:neutral ceramidase